MAKIGEHFRTDQRAEVSGYYSFAYYTDGTTLPGPTLYERSIFVGQGDEFPNVGSIGRDAWWRLRSMGK
jgi:hypothetical protein